MITQAEYAQRRQQVMDHIGEGSIFIVPTAHEYIRNGDSHFPFRPHSDFYYLTGFTEPEAILVLMPGRAAGEYILFNRERDAKMEIWDGRRAGQQGACADYAADEAYSINEFVDILPTLLASVDNVYYAIGQDSMLDELVDDALNELRSQVRSGIKLPTTFHNAEPILHTMRLHKSPAEIALMRQSAQITVAAHRQAMQQCQPGMAEYEIEAIVQQQFGQQGARFPAYPSIVAGGENSCILHYIENNATLNDGELLLIDAGAEYHYYSADVTRTFPINGTFNTQQKALYELVLTAQLAAIDLVKPGTPFNVLQETVVKILTTGLVDLGLLQGDVDTLIAEQAYQAFYMHRVSHWLGLDTHDVGAYKDKDQWRCLEPGMVLTIEPGIYTGENTAIDTVWHNIGIRIEDDVLVTETGHEVLSDQLEKTVADIETLMS